VTLMVILVGFFTMSMLSASLLIHLHRRRRAAHTGDEEAAKKLILPAFKPLLVLLGVVDSTFCAFLIATVATEAYSKMPLAVVLEVIYCGHRFDLTIVLVLLLQKSISNQANVRAAVITLLLSAYTLPVVWYATTNKTLESNRIFQLSTNILRAMGYLLNIHMIIRPPNRATTRTVRELCAFGMVHCAGTIATKVLLRDPTTAHQARYIFYANMSWVALTPLVIWRVLRADTDYWRGLGERAGALQQLFQHKHALQERVSARGLHVLIEMHRKHVIDFAYLNLEVQIGAGSTSNVFRGTLKTHALVAVKVYTPERVTEDVLAAFSHEAAMCAALRHPNVVSFLGLCVAPPAVCLVFELCQGNLDDVMCAHARRKYHPLRQQMLINVGYMLDAARAVAYLHSFVPAIVHRDIQPSNFLVDMECNVKLADFGESRALASLRDNSLGSRTLSATAPTDGDGGDGGDNRFDPYDRSKMDRLWHGSSEARGSRQGVSVYAAPEILRAGRGDTYDGEAADMYAFGVTMWDILYPFASHFRDPNSPVADSDGALSCGTDRVQAPLDQQVPTALRELINGALRRDPRCRPNARSAVSVLEQVQRELSVEVASRMMFDLQQFDDPTHQDGNCEDVDRRLGAGMIGGGVAIVHRFAGALAADRMVDRNYVSSPVEGIRMGNAFMDAGLLHHATHSRRFENSGELYFFDNVAALFRNSISSSGEDSSRQCDATERRTKQRKSAGPYQLPETGIPMLVSSRAPSSQSSQSFFINGCPDCDCRRLARRLETSRSTARPRLGLDSLRQRKRPRAPLTEVIVENDVDMEINHVFDSFQDEDDRRKARFAA
jgi:serine/threonine protein kinase